jgi:hypothetical protein
MIIKASFVGANPEPRISGAELMKYKCNFFIGRDPDNWHTDVPNYRAVAYEDVYAGIDLKYYGNGRRLEYDFIASPGADLAQIQIAYDGVESISVNDLGELVVEMDWGKVIERRPYVYQELEGERVEVDAEYALLSENSFTFRLSDTYNPLYAVVIDPVLEYSTYLGGAFTDVCKDIAVDGSGKALVTGLTLSSDFPFENPFGGTYGNGNYDVFITKLDEDGDELEYSTYLGGEGSEQAYGIAVDNSGNAYLTGFTDSRDFPTLSAFQPELSGRLQDAFIAKLSANGNMLIYSTYLGDPDGKDWGRAIAIDAGGNAYIAGSTDHGPGFPLISPFQSEAGPCFVAKIGRTGSDLLFSTYLGKGKYTFVTGIAVDGDGQANVCGYTDGRSFPLQNPYQIYQGDPFDAFVTKFTPSGSELVFSTCLGGAGWDQCYAIALDNDDNIYLTGETTSMDFPTIGAVQENHGGRFDSFVSNLASSGESLLFSTFIGGSNPDYGRDIALDTDGNIVVCGQTGSIDFPVRNPLQANAGDVDVFVAKISTTVPELLYSTYLGGSGREDANGIAVDGSGAAYIGGYTKSDDFPTANAHDNTFAGGVTDAVAYDAFVAKLSGVGGSPQPSPCGDLGFRPLADGWGFGNSDGVVPGNPPNYDGAIMWPRSWWEPTPGQYRFDYCEDPYPVLWCYLTNPSDFPDWPLFVDAFGKDQCYYSEKWVSLRAFRKWHRNTGPWRGSCFGFAITAGLIFDQMINATGLFPASTINDNRRLLINRYFVHQMGEQHLQYKAEHRHKSPTETLVECQEMFNSTFTPRDDRILALLWTTSEGPAGHAVNPYRCEQDAYRPNIYYISVYDNNFPGVEKRITVDVLEDLWYYDTYNGIDPMGEYEGLILMDNLSTYLSPPLLKVPDRSAPYFSVYVDPSLDCRLSSTVGVAGIEADSFYTTLTAGIPIFPMTSEPTLPSGYFLPRQNWTLFLNGREDTEISTTVFGARSVIEYSGAKVSGYVPHLLRLPETGDAIWVINPDSLAREYSLELTIDDTDIEASFELTKLRAGLGNSVLFIGEEGNTMQIRNHGKEHTYDLKVTTLGEAPPSTLEYTSIPIAEGTAHRVPSEWSPSDERLVIMIDPDLSGVFSDSIVFSNSPTGVDDGSSGEILPDKIKLGQNYPNPFNPVTRIEFTLARPALATLEIYNIIGNKVCTLVDEFLAPGATVVEWHGKDSRGNDVPSGVYFYRLSCDGESKSKKMLLLR